MKKPYTKKGKLYLGGKKGGFISPLATVARILYFHLQKIIVLPAAKELIGLGKKRKHRRPTKPRKTHRIKFQ